MWETMKPEQALPVESEPSPFDCEREQSSATEDPDTLPVHCECISISAIPGNKRLLALADVMIDISGGVISINGIRIEREANGISVRFPIDRDGRALVSVPDEVREALADVVIAAGLEAGVLAERVRAFG
jgi:stage V sporulation protein G